MNKIFQDIEQKTYFGKNCIIKKYLLTKKNYQIDINTLQSIALKYHSTSQIQQQVFKSLKTRYFMAYQMFLKDRDRYTSIEDLRTITGLKKNLFV